MVQRVIGPALDKGVWVLCDRFSDSTTAYQGYGRGFDVAAIQAINQFAVQGCEPDLTILLDLEIASGMDRLARRNREQNTGRDRFEREDLEFHERVRAGYLRLARQWPARIRLVNTMRAPSAVEADVWRIVSDVLEP